MTNAKCGCLSLGDTGVIELADTADTFEHFERLKERGDPYWGAGAVVRVYFRNAPGRLAAFVPRLPRSSGGATPGPGAWLALQQTRALLIVCGLRPHSYWSPCSGP